MRAEVSDSSGAGGLPDSSREDAGASALPANGPDGQSPLPPRGRAGGGGEASPATDTNKSATARPSPCEGAGGEALPAMGKSDASDLVATIDRARRLLDEGDLVAARIVSGAAYEQAKAASAHAARVKASIALRGKANRLQGDALLILARVDMAMADAVDAGQAAGEIATKGRKSNVQAADISTLDDLGLDRRRLAEARKLRDLEAKTPGLAERAIAVMVSQGLSPSRARLNASIGTKAASKAERGDQLYETPREAVLALLSVEAFDAAALGLGDDDAAQPVLEPCCGRGAISSVLEERGFEVLLADKNDYGTVTRHGECQLVTDFFDTRRNEPRGFIGNIIITNPPYGEVMDRFIRHALEAHQPAKMALLVNLNCLSGFENEDRLFWRETWPPTRAWINTRRLPMMHRDGWDGPVASSSMNTMWLVWDATAADASGDKPYGQATVLKYLDWKNSSDFSREDAGASALPAKGPDGQSPLSPSAGLISEVTQEADRPSEPLRGSPAAQAASGDNSR